METGGAVALDLVKVYDRVDFVRRTGSLLRAAGERQRDFYLD